ESVAADTTATNHPRTEATTGTRTSRAISPRPSATKHTAALNGVEPAPPSSTSSGSTTSQPTITKRPNPASRTPLLPTAILATIGLLYFHLLSQPNTLSRVTGGTSN